MRVNSIGLYTTNLKSQNLGVNGVNGVKKGSLINSTAGTEQSSLHVPLSPNFTGNAGKIVGGLLGLAAICVICPAAVGIGLGGLGLGPGMLLGAAYDEKMEEKKNKKDNNNNNNG